MNTRHYRMDVKEHETLSNNTLVQLSLSIYLFAIYNKQGYNNNTLVKEQRVVRKDTDVNEHERLSNITPRHKLK